MKRSLILIAKLACVLIVMCVTSSGFHAHNAAKDAEAPVQEPVKTTVAPQAARTVCVEIEEHNQADSDEQPEAEVMYFTENDVSTIAKILYLECRGVNSDTEKACVAWTILNRIDCKECSGETINEVATAPKQFAYSDDAPVTDELHDLAMDVLTRWNDERNGKTSVGRVLPTDYCWFVGDGAHNYFRNAYNGNYSIWDYSLPSPYES